MYIVHPRCYCAYACGFLLGATTLLTDWSTEPAICDTSLCASTQTEPQHDYHQARLSDHDSKLSISLLVVQPNKAAVSPNDGLSLTFLAWRVPLAEHS